MASSLLSTDFLISETVDPIVFTAVAVVGGLWLLNKLLSTNDSRSLTIARATAAASRLEASG